MSTPDGHRKLIKELIEELAECFGSGMEARQLAASAGLPPGKFPSAEGVQAGTWWTEIVSICKKGATDGLRPLVTAALEKRPYNRVFQDADRNPGLLSLEKPPPNDDTTPIPRPPSGPAPSMPDDRWVSTPDSSESEPPPTPGEPPEPDEQRPKTDSPDPLPAPRRPRRRTRMTWWTA